MEGTWGVDFFELTPRPGEFISDKHSFSAFTNPKLDAWLREQKIETLLFTGVATNVCVDSTLRAGFFLGYNVVLVEDCVGSNNLDGHKGTLATVRVNFGHVVSSSEAIDCLRPTAMLSCS